jgi:hypothetical protein
LHYALILVIVGKAAAVSKALKKGISKKHHHSHKGALLQAYAPQAYVPKKEYRRSLNGHSIIKSADHGVLDEVGLKTSKHFVFIVDYAISKQASIILFGIFTASNARRSLLSSLPPWFEEELRPTEQGLRA